MNKYSLKAYYLAIRATLNDLQSPMTDAIKYISYPQLIKRASCLITDIVEYVSHPQSVEQASANAWCGRAIPCSNHYHFKAAWQHKISNYWLTRILDLRIFTSFWSRKEGPHETFSTQITIKVPRSGRNRQQNYRHSSYTILACNPPACVSGSSFNTQLLQLTEACDSHKLCHKCMDLDK